MSVAPGEGGECSKMESVGGVKCCADKKAFRKGDMYNLIIENR